MIMSPEGATELPTSSQPEPTETWRVFIAVELPATLRARIINYVDSLRSVVPEVRASWAREDNLHLTLKFLGDTSVARIETLSQVAQRAANTVAPFEIVVEGCGSFPERGQPRVLWIGVLSEPPAVAGGPDLPASPLPLCSLHSALEDECATAGFAREPRDFHPHLTIARIRKPQGSRQLAAMHQEIGFNRETIGVSELVVIRSELLSEGSRHTVISRHSLSP
jgi:2'-5' RNA ligase